jgi:hypothetical protein
MENTNRNSFQDPLKDANPEDPYRVDTFLLAAYPEGDRHAVPNVRDQHLSC